MIAEKPIENKTQTTSSLSTDVITQRKIGGTTYIVTSEYDENAQEGLLDKIWRLIQSDAD